MKRETVPVLLYPVIRILSGAADHLLNRTGHPVRVIFRDEVLSVRDRVEGRIQIVREPLSVIYRLEGIGSAPYEPGGNVESRKLTGDGKRIVYVQRLKLVCESFCSTRT